MDVILSSAADLRHAVIAAASRTRPIDPRLRTFFGACRTTVVAARITKARWQDEELFLLTVLPLLIFVDLYCCPKQ